MTKRLFPAFACVLCLVLHGCATVGNPSVQYEALTSQIIAGQTTKEEVRSLLGPPTTLISTSVNGHTTEIWAYAFTDMQTNPFLFVPIIGLLAAASPNAVTIESASVGIVFSKDGIVQSISRSHTKTNPGEPTPLPEEEEEY